MSGKKPPKKGTAGGRLRRYARVSTAAAGVAARAAGRKALGLKTNQEAEARRLMETLGALKGPLVKVAQLLATVPGALPPAYAEELQKLQSQAPPMGWAFVRRRLRGELGEQWESLFRDFGREAAAAASLGQVHRATMKDGTAVACKLQYPDMESAVEADLRQLGAALSVFGAIDGTIGTDGIRREIADRLREELDYDLEARHAGLYADILKDEPGVRVPRVIAALSTSRLLTAEWLEGASVLSLDRAPQKTRDDVAFNLFRAWYAPLYGYGVIHGDPHLGNYTVRPDGGINLLDFGCVRVFPPAFVEGVILLYRALQSGKADMAVAAYEKWGFRDLNRATIAALNQWAAFLYAPVLDDRARLIGDKPDKGVYGRDTARAVYAELKKSGGVSVPREFVFMDRAALGLGSVFLRLEARVNWHRLFNEMIADFDVKALAGRQARALKKHGLNIKA